MSLTTKGMATVLLKQFSVEECSGFDRCCCHLLIHGIVMTKQQSFCYAEKDVQNNH